MMHRFLPVLLALGLIVGACSSSESDEAASTESAPTTTQPPTSATAETTEDPASDETTTTESTTTVVTAPDRPTFTISVDRRIPYTTDPERSLGGTSGYVDVFAPEGDGPWPVVVFLHAAFDPEWISDGEPHSTAACPPDCEAFYDAHLSHLASRGTLVVYVTYEWRVGASVDRLVADVSCVGPMVTEVAAQYGGDVSRTVVAGHSRGATIAAALALGGFSSTPSEDCVAQGDLRPGAVGMVGLSGDYPLSGVPDPDDPDRIKIPLLARESFAPADEVVAGVTAADFYATLSGYAHIGAAPTPRIHLFYGTSDDVGAPDQAVDFGEALRAAGYEVTVDEYEGEHHESIHLPASPGEAPAELTAAHLANLEAILGLAHG